MPPLPALEPQPLPLALLKSATQLANLKANKALSQFLVDRTLGTTVFGTDPYQDEIHWFLSKRAHDTVNRWLMNSRWSGLEPVSPSRTGYVSITRERIEHIVAHRRNQMVGSNAVQELLCQLLVEVGASLSPNQSSGNRDSGYDKQLVMFRAGYKSKLKEVSGESPSIILSYITEPMPHLKIETGFWIRGSKAAALQGCTLK